jgi:hypothetical protein
MANNNVSDHDWRGEVGVNLSSNAPVDYITGSASSQERA